MKYVITHACGHTETVELVGREKDRARKITFMEGEDCWECQKKASLEDAMAWTAEMELPDLIGTEKQVAWALSLRKYVLECGYEALDDEEKHIMDLKERGKHGEGYKGHVEKRDKIMSFIDELISITDAKYWIDSRCEPFYLRLSNYTPKSKEELIMEREQKELRLSQKRVLSPEEITGETIVEIEVVDGKIYFTSEKDEHMIEVMHKIGAMWDRPHWIYSPWKIWGDIKHIASDLAHRFLKDGYKVIVYDDEIADMTINATFTPEDRRWITWDESTKRACIYVRGLDTYDKAKSIKSAKYSKPYVKIRPVYYADIEDFAREEGYNISETAQAYLDAEKAKVEKVDVKEIQKIQSTKETVDYDALLEELKG